MKIPTNFDYSGLPGLTNELIEKLKEQMQEYAKSEQFEKAARLRDSYFDLPVLI